MQHQILQCQKRREINTGHTSKSLNFKEELVITKVRLSLFFPFHQVICLPRNKLTNVLILYHEQETTGISYYFAVPPTGLKMKHFLLFSFPWLSGPGKKENPLTSICTIYACFDYICSFRRTASPHFRSRV